MAVPVLPAHQLVPGPARVGDAAAERLALAVDVAVRDLVGLAAADGWKGEREEGRVTYLYGEGQLLSRTKEIANPRLRGSHAETYSTQICA